MARPLRIEFAGALYHVTARGNERKAIYRTVEDRRRFLAVLAAVVAQFRLLVHAYVLMDNHYHLLVETLEPNLRRAMHRLNGVYAQFFNRRHQRVGHLLQGRYRAPLVQHDRYLLELSRYIHLNPVRAHMVARAADYEWSSARAYVGECAVPPFLTVGEVLGQFDSRLRPARRRYAAFLADAAAAHGLSPLDALVAQTLLGEPGWVEAMNARIAACLRAGRLPLDRAEVPAVRHLGVRPTLAQVVAAVAAATRTAPAEIRRPGSRAVARAVAIYVAHEHTGLLQKDVGAAFGISAFAVSKAVAAITRTRHDHRPLRHLLQRLCVALQVPPP
jgi:REP element-mobilizing transposase RayT